MSDKQQAVLADRSKPSTSRLRARVRDDLTLSQATTLPAFVIERSRTEEVLQLLTKRLLHAQEDERRNVARELHDGLNQTLAMLGVEVGIVLNRLPNSARSVRRQLNKIRGCVEQLSEEVRQISHRLHPAVLEHLGLVCAVRSHCSEFEKYQNVRVLFVHQGSTEQIPFQVGVCLYRIVQEALRNAARHGNANEVIVNLTLSEAEIKLLVADDGCGFDVTKASRNSGLGLVSMEERARLAGGRFSIDSQLGVGTRVEVVVPAGRH